MASNDSAFEGECAEDFLDFAEPSVERPKTANKELSEVRPFTAADHSSAASAGEAKLARVESDAMLTESRLAYRAKSK